MCSAPQTFLSRVSNKAYDDFESVHTLKIYRAVPKNIATVPRFRGAVPFFMRVSRRFNLFCQSMLTKTTCKLSRSKWQFNLKQYRLVVNVTVILGDPRAHSRDVTKIMQDFASPIFVPSRLTTPGSPRMCYHSHVIIILIHEHNAVNCLLNKKYYYYYFLTETWWSLN